MASISKRARAFTLIELLVVVAIIVVMIALVLPSLSKARSTARAAACKANLHSIFNAFQIYVEADNDGYYPLGNYTSVNPSAASDFADPGKAATWFQAVFKPSGNSDRVVKILVCPETILQTGVTNAVLQNPDWIDPTFGSWNVSYAYNWSGLAGVARYAKTGTSWDYTNSGNYSLAATHGKRPWLDIAARNSKINRPASMCLSFDCAILTGPNSSIIPWYTTGWNGPGNGFAATYHPNYTCNVAYLDGHVEGMPAINPHVVGGGLMDDNAICQQRGLGNLFSVWNAAANNYQGGLASPCAFDQRIPWQN